MCISFNLELFQHIDMLSTYRVLVSLQMAWGNQGICTALSCHCPHVHCLLHYTVCLFPYTVSQWIIFSFQWVFLLFCLFCIYSKLELIKKISNSFKSLKFSSLLGNWRDYSVSRPMSCCFPGKFGSLRSLWCTLHVLKFFDFLTKSNTRRY